MADEIKTVPETAEVVDIQFRAGQKVYYFDPAGHDCKAGDHVIIDTARGPEYGICAGGNHMVPRKESQPRSSTACKELGILQRPHKSTQRFILSILNPVCDREPIFCISVFPLVCQVHISLRF